MREYSDKYLVVREVGLLSDVQINFECRYLIITISCVQNPYSLFIYTLYFKIGSIYKSNVCIISLCSHRDHYNISYYKYVNKLKVGKGIL